MPAEIRRRSFFILCAATLVAVTAVAVAAVLLASTPASASGRGALDVKGATTKCRSLQDSEKTDGRESCRRQSRR